MERGAALRRVRGSHRWGSGPRGRRGPGRGRWPRGWWRTGGVRGRAGRRRRARAGPARGGAGHRRASTVMWRCSSRLMVSASTCAPVASMAVTRDMRRIDDADARHVGELEEEVVGGGEEERSVEPVGHDVVVQERQLLVDVVRLVERHLLEVGRACRLAQGEEPGHDQADQDGGDQVEGDGGGRSDEQDGGVAAGRAEQRGQAGDAHHLDRRGDQDPGERGARDLADPPGRDQHDERGGRARG